MANPSRKVSDLPTSAAATGDELRVADSGASEKRLLSDLVTLFENFFLRLDTTNDPLTAGLHIETGSAGAVVPDPLTDDLIIEGSGDVGITIVPPDASFGGIRWTSPAVSGSAYTLIQSRHSSGIMQIGTALTGGTIQFLTDFVVPALELDANQKASFKALVNLTQTSAATDPTTTEYPADGDVGRHHNTVSNHRQVTWNDGGTLYWARMFPHGAIYGGIFVNDNTTETTITTQNVKVQVTVFDTDTSVSPGTTPDHTNDHVQVDTAGAYRIDASAVVESVSGAGSTFELTVQINNGASVIPGFEERGALGGGGSDFDSKFMTGIAALAVNDTIELWIVNETNTQNYIIDSARITLFFVA